MLRSSHSSIVEIPLANSQGETVELNLADVKDIAEVVNTLECERAKLQIWIRIAKWCYKERRVAEFLRLLEEAVRLEALIRPSQMAAEHRQGLEEIYSLLASFYTQTAGTTTDVNQRATALRKAGEFFSLLGRKTVEDQTVMLAHGFFLLWSGDSAKAKLCFNLMHQKHVAKTLTQIGLAGVHLREGHFREALQAYQAVLQNNPDYPAAVRVGIGYCLAHLGRIPNAMTAFERAREIDPRNASALVGLAVLEINTKKRDIMKKGYERLMEAYNLDNRHPEALNHLANRYVIRKEYDRARHFAQHAVSCSGAAPEILAESFYHIARTFHAQGDFDQAFQYYQRSVENAPNFVLALYGLGQMYLHRKDTVKARHFFELVEKEEPNSYEVQKILGSLLAASTDAKDAERAETLLNSVTLQHPDDVEAWLDLAGLLERSSPQKALDAYGKAVGLLVAAGMDTPPEVDNNIGSLYFKLGQFAEAHVAYGRAKGHCERLLKGQLSDVEKDYYSGLAVSITYNTARALEESHNTEAAAELYKRMQETHKSYTQSVLRLGAIAQQRGQFREAADNFSHAAALVPSDPTAWAMQGSLHMGRREWQMAQKKYEKILADEACKEDPYTVLALANVYLCASPDDTEKQQRYFELAQRMYCSVLQKDPHNVFAANGIGCILAYRGEHLKAKDVFLKVREAASADDTDLLDAWLNLAHAYVELEQYENAIQLYQKCVKRPGHGPDARVLTYLARAHVRHGQPEQAYAVLLRALHVQPADLSLRFNIAVALQRMADAELQRPDRSTKGIRAAMGRLKEAGLYFKQLAQVQQQRYNYNPKTAHKEWARCADMLRQAENLLQSVDRKEREAQEKLEQQKQARRELEEKKRQEMEERDRQRKEHEARLRERAGEFQKMVEDKNILTIEPPPPSLPKEKSTRGRKRKTEEDEDEEEPSGNALSASRVRDSEDDGSESDADGEAEGGSGAAAAPASAAPSQNSKRRLVRPGDSDDDADADMDVLSGAQGGGGGEEEDA